MAWSDPVTRMRELVEALRTIWTCWQTGEPLAVDGQHYRLSLMPPAFRPQQSAHPMPPVYLAAVGPGMARLAGEIADGLFLHAFTTPAYVRQVIMPAVTQGLQATGRSRSDISICYSAFTAYGRTQAQLGESREADRAQVAFYGSTPAYRPVLDVHGLGDLQSRLQALTRGGHWDRLSHEVSDEVLDLFAISGGADEICARSVSCGRVLSIRSCFPPSSGRPMIMTAAGPMASRRSSNLYEEKPLTTATSDG